VKAANGPRDLGELREVGANLLTPFERVEVEGGGEVFFIGDLSA